MKRRKLSAVSAFHYFRLTYRSILFLGSVGWYIHYRLNGIRPSIRNLRSGLGEALLALIWVIFMVEMFLRFFPSRLESPGCQKQFRRNYRPSGRTDVQLHDNSATLIVAMIWVLLNAVIGRLYMIGFLDEGILLVICMAYSVCDMICILFFCPFQTWFLKNKCCCSCRIYNWDYAMMFTPLFFVRGMYTWTLLAAAVCLLVRWEIAVWRYPERFSENTNAYLSCASCSEKLCTHKTQLNRFRKSLMKQAEETVQRILAGQRR